MLYQFALGLLITSVSADCSRAFLKDATDKYTAAQAAGQSNAVAALATSNLTYIENAKAMSITNSTLSHPIKIDFNRSVHDTVQCATFTEIIAATDPHPYVIHTRMVFTDQKASLIES